MMVDAARAFLPLPMLKSYVIMCRLYKINYLHMHLTDDGSFTFPSAKYPELSQKAPWKYNASDLAELQAFASVRGVAIVGEMDVPGPVTVLSENNETPFLLSRTRMVGAKQPVRGPSMQQQPATHRFLLTCALLMTPLRSKA